jgi:hypothetical protein
MDVKVEEKFVKDVRSERVVLSSNGLQRLSDIGSEKFRIIFGDETIECNRFQAIFLSNAIRKAMFSDNSVNEFEITGCKDSIGVDSFKAFSALIDGSSSNIEINENNCRDFELLFKVLDNDELLNQVIRFQIGDENLSTKNCISRLEVKARNNINYQDELRLVASKFYKFCSSELKKFKGFEVEVLEEILNSENLCLNNEDSLVWFISSLGESFSSLYNYVELQYLTTKGIDRFLFSSRLETINCRCWESICRRLRMDTCNCSLNNKRFFRLNIPFRNDIRGKRWKGIIAHFTEKCGGNVYGKGLVDITSSGDQRNECWQIVDREEYSSWTSTNMPNSWICFDFRDKSVSLQHYTLESKSDCYHYFIEWQIEGSKDGNTWKILDYRNTKELCGNGIAATYKCCKVDPNEFFRFIRMKQTGRNSDDDYSLSLGGIEFFGVVSFANS